MNACEKMKSDMRLLRCVLVLMLVFASNASAETLLTFTTADDQSHNRAQSMNRVLTHCFQRMGIAIEIIPMPSKRSLITADKGIEDGNFVRTRGIEEAYPNLIRVPEPISVNHIVAFSKNSSIRVDGWKSLEAYHVAYVNGWRNCERELQNPKDRTVVKDEFLLFTLLKKDRADLGIFGKETGMQVLEHLGYSDIKALEPPVAVSDLFLYVHKQHHELIPHIVKTLQEMKADGTYDRLVIE